MPRSNPLRQQPVQDHERHHSVAPLHAARTVLIPALLVNLFLLTGGCPQPADMLPGENDAGQVVPGVVDGEGTCPAARSTFTEVIPTVYFIAAEFRFGPDPGDSTMGSIASAFAIGPNLLATNAHVVDDLFRDGVNVVEVTAAQSGTRFVTEVVAGVTHPDYNGNPLSSPDIGLLRTAEELPAWLALPAAEEVFELLPGDVLLLSGFPGDVTRTLPIEPGVTVPQATSLIGSVSALRSFDPNSIVTPGNVDVIQHQLPVTPGTSGSPLIACGQLVAVNNAGTVTSVVSVGPRGELIVSRQTVAENSFGIHVSHLLELVARLEAGEVTEQTLS